MNERTYSDQELIEVEHARDYLFHAECLCKCGIRLSQHPEYWKTFIQRGAHRFEEMSCRIE